MCEKVCRRNAIDLKMEGHIDLSKCNLCGDCVYHCPADAYKIFGEDLTCEELISEVMKDWKFYKKSGGGITVSGGEPTLQGSFLIEFLKGLRSEGIHTAVETNGYMDVGFLDQLVPLIDQFLFDVKHMDSSKHKIGTGVGNEIIQSNLRKLALEYKTDITIRIPLIPGFNDDDANLIQSAELAKELGLKVDILKFHNMAAGKYQALQRNYEYAEQRPQSRERIIEILNIFKKRGVDIRCDS